MISLFRLLLALSSFCRNHPSMPPPPFALIYQKDTIFVLSNQVIKK
jgi:hypothetical protein